MQYREFGETKNKVSLLGFGTLRLPSLKNDDACVDIEKSMELMCKGFELGINYVDTAYTYRGGQCEAAVGEALKNTDQKVFTSTKFPLTQNPQSGDYRRYLEQSLKRMQVEFIDYYHFHALSRETFDSIVIPQGFLKEAVQAKEQGLIRHISFSFHDEPEAIRYIIDRGEIFETLLCQYNIIFRENEQMMAYAKEQGLGVNIMGPLAGGKFVVADEVLKNTDKKVRLSSTAEIALRFVLNNPNVDMVLSGMKDLNMVSENVNAASELLSFTDEENECLNRMVTENKILSECYCTECCYCMPCPMGINIPYIFRILNYHKVDGLTAYAKQKFKEFETNERKKIMLLSADVDIGKHPSACVNCRKCVNKCPQKLRIPNKLKEAVTLFTE